ncbi:hypothetical protein PENSUB_12354 [Penicillium subrubescens]|uniref:Uncharacterized protein n=2 Tax=Penicillium subrubescens TaxID=1316194 RepID=A0A1Q5SZ42_9EURO|nr:hypothetical protein PENSUB_12354 [Penicillium subrubescens]
MTVASYTTAYLAVVTESALVSQSMTTSVQPVVVSTLSPAQPHVFGQGASGNHTTPHTLSSSSWKSGIASSGSTQAATQATEINTVSGKTISSVTAGAPGSLFTGDAHKMWHSSILFPMAAVLSALLFF